MTQQNENEPRRGFFQSVPGQVAAMVVMLIFVLTYVL